MAAAALVVVATQALAAAVAVVAGGTAVGRPGVGMTVAVMDLAGVQATRWRFMTSAQPPATALLLLLPTPVAAVAPVQQQLVSAVAVASCGVRSQS